MKLDYLENIRSEGKKMKNSFKVLSAAAVAAVFATSLSAQQLPLNNTVAGGQGDEQIDGQAGVIGLVGGLGAATVGLVVVTVVAVAASVDSGSSSSTTLAD
jgi:hypothetical protein